METLNEEEILMEGLATGMLTKMGIAVLLAIPSLMPAKDIEKQITKSGIPVSQLRINSPAMKQIRAKAVKEVKMLGPMSETNVVNATGMVIWLEARNQTREGRLAIASTILNRTDNQPEYIVAVLTEDKQFSCVKPGAKGKEATNAYTGGWTDKTYDYFNPGDELKNPKNLEIWNECIEIATQLVQKKFKSTIGNMNSYLNPKTADEKAVNSWGKKCTKKIGNHYFGYLPEHDGKIVVPGTMKLKPHVKFTGKTQVHTVVKGENPTTIAKKYNMSVADLRDVNPHFNPKKLQIGQKLKVKALNEYEGLA